MFTVVVGQRINKVFHSRGMAITSAFTYSQMNFVQNIDRVPYDIVPIPIGPRQLVARSPCSIDVHTNRSIDNKTSEI